MFGAGTQSAGMAVTSEQWELTDGVASIRPPVPSDAALIVAARDHEAQRRLGPGVTDPSPTACIVVGGEVVGWVDVDVERDWLAPGEVNLGYSVFPHHRGHGYATRAVELLLRRLAADGEHHTATLTIALDNHASLAVARKARFALAADLHDNLRFTRRVGTRDGGCRA